MHIVDGKCATCGTFALLSDLGNGGQFICGTCLEVEELESENEIVGTLYREMDPEHAALYGRATYDVFRLGTLNPAERSGVWAAGIIRGKSMA